MKKWACYGSTVKVFNPDSYFKLKNRFLIFLFVLFHVHHCTYVSKKIFPVTLLLHSLFYKFHFPNNGKNKHAHSVYNSTELHMSWTPGAINLLSSKKASKILWLFFGGGGAWQRYYMCRAFCYLTNKSSAPFCVAENCRWNTCSELSVLSAWFPPTTPRVAVQFIIVLALVQLLLGKTAATQVAQEVIHVVQSHGGI